MPAFREGVEGWRPLFCLNFHSSLPSWPKAAALGVAGFRLVYSHLGGGDQSVFEALTLSKP